MTSLGPRLLVALSIVVASAAAALHQTPRRAHAYVPAPMPPTFAARCAVHGVEARTHAQALEHRALLHWQRAPFESSEASRALRLIAEAEVCFGAAGDRNGAQRTASRHRRYVAETSRQEHAQSITRYREEVEP
ncbi:MAG TPA: hypothetical protein VFX59_00875 [Polyangiales bacterium]|nr:hypothetical protein [Polyangiales bacterium]